MQAKAPVVLDIHAEWCNPCKVLGPMLEKAVRAQQGRVLMAKLDADANAGLTQQLRVTSLPTVLGVHNGKLVDSFTGLIPEEQVKSFVLKLAALDGASSNNTYNVELEAAKSTLDQLSDIFAMDKSKRPASFDIHKVSELLQTIAQYKIPPKQDGSNPSKEEEQALAEAIARSQAFLTQCALEEGNVSEAQSLAEKIRTCFPELSEKHKDIVRILALVKLGAVETEGDEDIKQLQNKLEENPKDEDALLQLANILISQSKYEEGINQALHLLKVNKNYKDGAAQQLLLDVFEALGQENELVKKGRKRMTSLLLV